jgi:hypothetical protein
MIFYIFASFVLKLLLDLPLMILGYFIVAVALCYERNNHLPPWAEWCWGNKDHGNDGEGFWAARTVGWSRFRRCYWWLAVRNPTFNWSKYILGYRSDGVQKVIYCSASSPGEIGDKRGAGFYYIREGLVWDIYWIKPYSLFGLRRCIRFRAGWKIEGKERGEVAQFVFAPNPFHPYSG